MSEQFIVMNGIEILPHWQSRKMFIGTYTEAVDYARDAKRSFPECDFDVCDSQTHEVVAASVQSLRGFYDETKLASGRMANE